MARTLLIVLGAAIAAVFVAGMAEGAKTVLKGEGFTFDLPDLEGNQVSRDDERFEDKVVLVDIWGKWCMNCRRAMPTLISLQEKYGEAGLVIVGVAFEHETDVDKRRALIQRTIDRMGINFLVLDGGHTEDLFASLPDLEELEDIPTVILSGRDGVVRFIKTGFADGDEGIYEAAIEAALARP